MVADLPEPARRYSSSQLSRERFYTVGEITMEGRFGMGDRDNPNYLDFSATQVLAVPEGFVWKMRAGVA